MGTWVLISASWYYGPCVQGGEYGDGPTLEHKQRVLQKSAFSVMLIR